MKAIYSYFIIFFFCFCSSVSAQTKNNSQNPLLPNSLRVTYVVQMKDTTFKIVNSDYVNFTELKNVYFRKESHETKQMSVVDLIMEKVLGGKVALYDAFQRSKYFPYNLLSDRKAFTSSEILERMGGGNDTIFVETYSGELEKKVIERNIDLNQIKSLMFSEEWNFDADKFDFQKKVLCVSPIRHYYKQEDVDNEDEKMKIIGDILFPENQSPLKNPQHIAHITFEYFLNNPSVSFNTELDVEKNMIENDYSPFWSSYSRNILIDKIVNSVLQGNIQPYSFTEKKPITIADAREKLGIKEIEFEVYDPYGNISTKKIMGEFQFHDVKSIVFEEDWFIDMKTLQVEKNVKAIAPVIYEQNEEDLAYMKKVPFIIYLDEYKKKSWIIDSYFTNENYETDSSLCVIQANQKFGILNKKENRILLAAEYDSIVSFSGNVKFLLLKKNGKYGLFNKEELKIATQPEYDKLAIGLFSEYIEARKDKKVGLLDARNGSSVLPVVYSGIDFNSTLNKYFILRKDSLLGLFDKDERKILFNTEYSNFKLLNENYLLVQKKKEMSLFNTKNGKTVIPSGYDDITSLIDTSDIYQVLKNGKYGLFDINTSAEILPLEYDLIEYLGDNLYKVEKNTKFGLFSIKERKFILPDSYSNLLSTKTNNVIIVGENGENYLFNIQTHKKSSYTVLPYELLTCANSIVFKNIGYVDVETFELKKPINVDEILKKKWQTYVGFVSYRSNIIEENGKIYVGSNGASRIELEDKYDGAYQLDAKTGRITKFYKPTKAGDNDVTGVALEKDRIYFGNDNYQFFCYKTSGKLLWEYKTIFDTECTPVLADLNGDGISDVIFTTQGNGITALNGKNGEEIWKKMVEDPQNWDTGEFIHSPAAYDLNNDGVSDIVYCTPTNFVALNGKTGEEIWKTEICYNQMKASPSIIFPNNELRIIGTSVTGKIFIFDRNGNILNYIHTNNSIVSTPVFTSDYKSAYFGVLGYYEMYDTIDVSAGIHSSEISLNGCDRNRRDYCDSSLSKIVTGKLWATQRTSSSGVVIENGDDKKILFVSEKGILSILNEKGDLQTVCQLPAGVEATPLLKDVDGDGTIELLIADYAGNLTCYSTPFKGKITIGQFRNNNKNSGVFRD